MVLVADRISVVVNGVECWAAVRRSKRARVTKIRALREGLEVVLPWRAPSRSADKILKANCQWVLQHTLRIVKDLRSFDQANLLYQGDEWKIEIVSTSPIVRLDSERKVFLVKADDPTLARQIVGRWIRRGSRDAINHLVTEWERRLGVKASTIKIRDQRSKWGSCSQAGGLNFNWRLALAPPTVMQAIVIHELAHLVHLNHSRQFWDLVAQHDPMHRKHEKWLKDNQHRLMEPFEPV